MRRIIVLSAIAALSFLSFCGCEKENPVNSGPKAETLSAEKGAFGAASLSGRISGIEGGAASGFECGIEYSSDASFPTGSTARQKAEKYYSEEAYTVTVSNLTNGQLYYYRAYYTNQSLTYYGELKEFTFTWETGKAETLSAEKGAFGAASLSGRISGIEGGAASDFECGIEYSSDASFPAGRTARQKAGKNYSEEAYTVTVGNLTNGQLYYYRACYTNQSLTYYGEVKEFTFTWEIEYMDLGLSVKWAIFNVGATKPEEYGDYYAWGETEPKDDYSWSTYKWCNGTYDSLTKYNTNSDYGTVDNKTVLDPEDDVAHVKWGGSWRMPTAEEQEELLNNCTWTWYDSDNTEFGGVAGYKVTSKINGYTDRFIFLPAAGYRGDTNLYYGGSVGLYWASSLDSGTPNGACDLGFFGSGGHSTNRNSRSIGSSVRPVCPSETWSDNISVTLDRESTTLHVGEVVSLTATVRKGNEVVFYSPVTWTSDKPEIASVSSPGIASVSSNGVVTAKAVGKARITVTVQDKFATCVIEVTAAPSGNYEYVDLGLSVNWATFNVGASKPEGSGVFYAWGETEPKDDYDWSPYKWRNGWDDSLTKYNTKSDYGTVDNKTVLDPEDDVAHVMWGGSWRMPTKAEWDELLNLNNCTWTWYVSGNTEFGGVTGYKVTSKIYGYTDRFIFLPAAGYRLDTLLYNGGSGGYYWSSSLGTDRPNNACRLRFSSGSHDTSYGYRCFGHSVRPVCP